MIIRSLLVRNYLALKDIRILFHPEVQMLTGTNGCGKTTVLRLLAGLAGTDEATRLVANQPIGEVELEIEDAGKTKTLHMTDKIDPKKVYKFKKWLSKRVSFPITTGGDSFVSECHPKATDKARLREIFAGVWRTDIQKELVYTSSSEPIRTNIGRGFTRAMSMILLNSPDEVPMLLDLPESSLDMAGKRMMIDILRDENRQMIIATHSPEILSTTYSKGSNYGLVYDFDA